MNGGNIMAILSSIQSVLSIILMLSVGYFFSHRKWFNEETSKLFSKIVVNLAVPAYMVSTLMSTYDKEKLIHLAKWLFIPFVSIILCYLLGMGIGKILNLPPNRRGIFVSTFSISNTIFVGLPVNIALFGEDSIPFVFIYFIANISLFWTIGVFGITGDGGKTKRNLFSRESLKRIFSPPLCGFIIAVLFIFMEMNLPKFLMDSLKYMGGMTTPLSMLYIGIIIYNINLKEIKWDKSMSCILIGRFVISPLLVFLLCSSMAIPTLMKKVFIIQSAMPAMSITSVIAEANGADHEYAAVVTTMTTIATLIFIPFYIIILSQI